MDRTMLAMVFAREWFQHVSIVLENTLENDVHFFSDTVFILKRMQSLNQIQQTADKFMKKINTVWASR